MQKLTRYVLTCVAITLPGVLSQDSEAGPIITLEFCGEFPGSTGGVLDGSFLQFDQSLVGDISQDYGLVDANILTSRTDLAPFPSDLTYTLADFTTVVPPGTTSLTSTVSGPPVTRSLSETVQGWRFLLPGAGEFFAVFPDAFLPIVADGDVLTNDLLTEFRADGSYMPDADKITNPEPSTLTLCGFGLICAAGYRRRHRRQTAATTAAP